VEHPRTDAASLTLKLVGGPALFLEAWRGDRASSRTPDLKVLRGPRVQADDARLEIDLTPLKREHLAPDAPAGDVGERHDRLRIAGQLSAHCLVLVILEEAGSHVLLLQHGDVGGR
jgi:hypothetical protein